LKSERFFSAAKRPLIFLPMPTVANFDEQTRTTVKVVLLQVGALA
jgi:hypothetical protein